MVLGSDAEQPGPLDADWQPFGRAVLDSMWGPANARFRGLIMEKPSQVGATTMLTIDLVQDQLAEAGSTLYVLENEDKSREGYERYLRPLTKKMDEVRQVQRTLEKGSAGEKGKRDRVMQMQFPNGILDIGHAGSESTFIGLPRRRVVLDEFEASSDNYPAKAGDLWTSANSRVKTYRTRGRVDAFGHPRLRNHGLDLLYRTISTCERWVIDCPHEGCGQTVALLWKHVHYRKFDEKTERPDPASAYFRCPHCKGEITDQQRARSLWPAGRGPYGGGTGRFESELSPEECARREWRGLAVTRLCDPRVTVASLAAGLAVAEKRGDAAVLEWFNKEEGEPYEAKHATPIDGRILDEITVSSMGGDGEGLWLDALASKIVVPNDVRFVTVGVDVQAPADNPTLYVWASAWGANGMRYVVLLERVAGWTYYQRTMLAKLGVRRSDGRVLGVKAAAVDAGYLTGSVLDRTRETVVSAVNGAVVDQIAVKYVPHLKADSPLQEAPERKRQHPTRPDMGPVPYFYAHRHTWVDRFMRRLREKRAAVLCRVPEDWREHLTANILRPVKKEHGYQADAMEWERVKEFRDDWAMAGGYDEIGAALRCDLDRIDTTADPFAVDRGGMGFSVPGFG